MVALLGDAVQEEGLGNLEVTHMESGMLPLPDTSEDIVVMAQVHHKVDAIRGACRKLDTTDLSDAYCYASMEP